MHGFHNRLVALLLCLALSIGCIPAVSEETINSEIIDPSENVTESENYSSESSITPTETSSTLVQSNSVSDNDSANGEPSESSVDRVDPESSVNGNDTESPLESSDKEITTDETEQTGSDESTIDSTSSEVIESTSYEIDLNSEAIAAAEFILSEMNGASLSDEFKKAEWLYNALLNCASHGNGITAYDALILGSANSTGYTYAYKLLLDLAGIENCIAVASDNSKIIWNIAKINGDWTHIDVYSDDSSDADYGLHFGLTDAAMARNHTWMTDGIPTCTSTAVNLYVRNKNYAAFKTESELRTILENCEGTAYIYAAGTLSPAEALNMLTDLELVSDINGSYASVTAADSDNNVMMLTEQASIITDETVYTICVGDYRQIRYSVIPSTAQATFYTQHSTICSVSETGLIEALKAGTSIVTIAIDGAISKITVNVVAAPTDLTLVTNRYNASAGMIYIGAGETISLDYTMVPAAVKPYASVKFLSANSGIASISPAGELTGITTGVTYIKAECFNGIGSNKLMGVTVVSAPSGISLSDESLEIGIHDSKILTATILGDTYDLFKLNYESTDTSVAVVDPSNGEISALRIGKCDIIVTTYNKKRAVCHVNVKSEPTSLAISGEYITIAMGDTLQLESTLLPEGSAGSVQWYSSSDTCATVSSSGLVYACAPGTVTITAKAYNGVSNTYRVSIQRPVTNVTLAISTSKIGIGESIQTVRRVSGFTNSYEYTSSDPNILAVDQQGVVTGLSAGNASIILKAGNVNSNPVPVTVYSAPERITAVPKSITLGIGETTVLEYALDDGSAGSVSLASDHEEIASVTPRGIVTAIAAGEAKIAMTTYNGKTAVCAITVKDAPTAVTILPMRTELGIDEVVQVNAVLEPTTASGKLYYSSSNTNVADVTADGQIHPTGIGEAYIYVTAYNGVYSRFTVTVRKAPDSIEFDVSRNVLGVGEQITTSHWLANGSAGSIVSYQCYPESNSPATIDSNGVITANHVGTSQFRCLSYNGSYSNIIEVEVVPAPTSISCDEETITLGASDTETLSYTLSEGSAGAVGFSSRKTAVCTVDESGRITAVAPGKTIIDLETYNGCTASCTVIVKPSPQQLILTADRVSFGVGEYYQLNTSYVPEDTTAKCSYASSNTKVATVFSNGMIYARAEGYANIYAYTTNGIRSSITISVVAAPNSVRLYAPRTILGVGESMDTVLSLSEGTIGAVEYQTYNASIATIDENGTVHAVSEGIGGIRVTTYNGKTSNWIAFRVASAPTSISFDTAEIELGVGAVYTASCTLSEGSSGMITYSSDHTDIAAVDETTGRITALKEGTCTITASTFNHLSTSCKVTVTPAPRSIRMDVPRNSLGVGETVQISAQLLPEGTTSKLTYASSAPYIASVDEDGTITANSAGKAIIYAIAYNYVYSSVAITVKNAPYGVGFSTPALTIGLGETLDLSSYVVITNGSETTFTYESENSGICSVDSVTGLIRGLGVGITTITVSTHNGKTAECEVSVLNAPQSISMSVPEILGVGQYAQATSTISPDEDSYASNYRKYSLVDSTNNSIIITDYGLIYAQSPGKATIRVSTYLPNVYDEKTIEVKAAPTFVRFASKSYTIDVDETLQLNPIIDSDAATVFNYSYDKKGYFTIDENGLLTPISRGTTTVWVSTHNGVYSEAITITINDPYFPEAISWTEIDGNPPLTMSADESEVYPSVWVPSVTSYPENSVAAMKWYSNDDTVITFDESIGAFKAVSFGVTQVYGISTRNPSLSIYANIAVTSITHRSLVPAAYEINIAGNSDAQIRQKMAENENLIQAIVDSTYSELAVLTANNEMTPTQMNSRKTIIDRAFRMLKFPWTTSANVSYWIGDYGTYKDYKVGMLYYGLPYTQTYRNYNQDNIVSEGYYRSSSNNTYALNTGISGVTARKYRGNDCSSFIDQAERGPGHYYNTKSLATSSVFVTLNMAQYYNKMQPGDILVRAGHHTVMFLYYTNDAHTQFMIIEQGGSDDKHTNVVTCRVKSITNYSKYSDYLIRRPIV